MTEGLLLTRLIHSTTKIYKLCINLFSLHLLQCFLSNTKTRHASRNPTIYGSLQQSLPNFDLRRSIADGSPEISQYLVNSRSFIPDVPGKLKTSLSHLQDAALLKGTNLFCLALRR
jgi:hypothetical protein